jgi:hypothetical protein
MSEIVAGRSPTKKTENTDKEKGQPLPVVVVTITALTESAS